MNESDRCSPEYLERFRELGIKSDGYCNEMETTITTGGYLLPGCNIEEAYNSIFNDDGEEFKIKDEKVTYGFILKHDKYWIRITLTYADALAEELILLKELELI